MAMDPIEAALYRVFMTAWTPPEFIVVGPVNAAIFDAYLAFSGRDRRRIKRECKKAARRARLGSYRLN